MINKNVFTKTKNSLIKVNIVVVVSLLIIFSIFIFSYFKNLTYNSIDNKLSGELNSVSRQLKNTSFFGPMVLEDPSNMVYIYEGDEIRYYTRNSYFYDLVPENHNKENQFFTYSKNGYKFRELSINIGKYRIQIIRNIDIEMNSFKQLIFVFIIGMVIALMITYFLALYLTKKALSPIETAWNNQAQFIQDASHEIRTPISIVSSKLESMLKSPNNTIGDEVETIADAMRETRRIKKMISDLLSLTKEEAIVKLNLESIDLKELIDEISNDYIDIAEIQNKNFEVYFDLKNKIITTDKNKLRQLIIIFIDNAFKYTKMEDNILIKVIQKDNLYIAISIIDTGIGINKEDIPHIFDRFFRSDNIRNKDIDGSGIGLSIAKMLSLNLKYNINVNSEIGKKTEFEIVIPNK
ncbi:HAMP domain-containing sensor histidine kinase [Clostridium sp. CCUG 7971]|uniref:sensor histidine kinase n=1 Tax=Clostridium sp. CCUG 7971 TaxID=2811414 RepID=UPI001ABAF547|nr:HAMP domain-containing sensor histidine kinase [Clostridium sp. CCUG 7971]MBO3442930.1 HAMP domain-containing histidine kinase [Clostridium sp. CCUG 7971]